MQRKLITLFILIIFWALLFVVNIHAEAPELTKEQLYDAQMEQWLDRLQADESGKNPLLVILDTNNKYSYGCLQFQAGTWQPYSKKYNVDKEIMDCQAQRYVANQMIKDDYNAWRNWFTSVTKKTAGKPPVMQEKTAI